MELKELGKTGVMVPEIGLGTWKYRGGVAPLVRGIELGARFIDTAEMYRTEDVVGQALQGVPSTCVTENSSSDGPPSNAADA